MMYELRLCLAIFLIDLAATTLPEGHPALVNLAAAARRMV